MRNAGFLYSTPESSTLLPMPPLAPFFIDLAGVAVFAISGALAAGRKSLDLLGVLVIATVTAMGGGTLRDLLLDRPVFWMVNTAYLWVIIAATVITLIYVRYLPVPRGALRAADALGLALFAISGAQIAEAAGYSGLIAIILGTMSGTAGGIVRDILTAEIPLILRSGEIHATAAIVGIAAYLALQAVGVNPQIGAYIGMAVVAILRFIAIYTQLKMPTFNL
jgi:uncharacterized membrane protein YeiH